MSAVKKTSDSTDRSTQKNLNRSVEKCLEEAQLSGVLKLSGRKLRDVAKLGTRSFDLTDVYKADLSKNRLFELPLELTECPSMETLNLYQNNIKSLPQEIIYLQSLTFLDLSRNQLSVLPPCLSQLPLQVLLVSHNKLVSLPEEFGRLASLLELDASCNEISHIPPQLGSLPKLHSLSLRRNLLVHIPLELTDLKLRKLDLGENRLEMLPVELRNMKQLEELRLDSNPLRSPPAYLCARGLVHVFKYLETQAAKEEREKNSSVIAPEPQRKLSQICDLRIFENCRSIRIPPSMTLSCNEKLQTEKEILDGDNVSNLSTNIADRSFKINGGSSRIPGAISPKEKIGISTNVSLPTSPVTADSPGAFESRIPGLRNGPGGNQKASPPSGNPPQTYRQYKESLKQQRENLYTRQKSVESPPVNGFPEQNPTSTSPGNVKPNLKESHSPAEIQPTPSFLHHVVTRVHPTHLTNGTTHLPLDTGQKHSNFSTSELPVRTRLEPSSGPPPRDVNDVPLRNPEKSSRPLSHGNQPPLPSANPPVHRLLPTPNRFPVKSGSRIPPPNPVSLVSYKSIDGNVQEQISALRQCIETRLKVSLPEDLGSALSDGVVLCHLANSVRPRSVSSIHVPSPAVPKLPLPKCKRNIENFIEACRKIGVDEVKIERLMAQFIWGGPAPPEEASDELMAWTENLLARYPEPNHPLDTSNQTTGQKRSKFDAGPDSTDMDIIRSLNVRRDSVIYFGQASDGPIASNDLPAISKIVIYLPKRDFIDHYTYFDSIDGIAVVPPGACFSRRMFVQVLLHFRYAAEAEEFTKYSFKKTVVLHSEELHPKEELPDGENLNKWQQSVIRRIGSVPGICPFKIELPVGTPPSLQVQQANGVQGEPCGLTYELLSYLGTDANVEPEARSSVRMSFRVLQAPPPSPTAVLKGLWADEEMPVGPPATCVSRQFLLTPGRVQIEMNLDKPALRSGERLIMSVAISNTTNKTVKKIKCKLLQCSEMSFASGRRRVPIATLTTQEGCPILPGSSLQRNFTLFPNLAMIRFKEGLVYEAALKGQPEKLAATTCFPNSNPRDGFAILVSYVARIKLYLGPMQDIAAEVPFILTHAPSSPVPTGDDGKPVAPVKPKFVRLVSVENTLDKEDEDDPFSIEMDSKPKENLADTIAGQLQTLLSF